MKYKILLLAFAAFASSCSDKNMTKNADNSYTINTLELGKDIRGYAGRLPISVTIKGDEIQSVKILQNQETPVYLERVENQMLPKFNGININQINTIDAVSGATYTSKALSKNVQVAVDYYNNKR
ncbi:MAG: FMN-binding protein [Bacteroidales bacterium]|nr:FMN-binding protein [Bacteroidales bacterium]